MHPRNIYYKKPADFGKMGEDYEEFRKHLIPTKSGNWTINFKDPKAFRELSISLLQHDFGLKVDLPLDRLIPAIPQRLNYIHWVEDLVKLAPKSVRNEEVKGIDIGTGSSCVFPLLGAKINNWKFCASEVDDLSFRYACENVKRNNLENEIQVYLVTPDDILKPFTTNHEHYDFCMCNPPFFSDESEATGGNSRSESRPKPSSICTGTVNETVTSGGEVDFVGRMINDSLELRTRIIWYTTMLGKKSSIGAVVSKLKKENIQKIVTTEFCQGRTTRWGVAWTFSSDMSMQDLPSKKRKSKPLQFSFSPKNENEISGEIKDLVLKVCGSIKEILQELQIDILEDVSQTSSEATTTRFHCKATDNTWANQRRKRREAARKLGAEHASEADLEPNVIKCCVHDEKSSGNEITCENIAQSERDLVKTSVSPPQLSFSNGNSVISQGKVGEKEVKKRVLDNTDVLSNTGYFIEFTVDIGVELSEIVPQVLPNFFLEMNWIDGQNRNSFYQLFQYFQNKLTR